jgi:hypothetical protein
MIKFIHVFFICILFPVFYTGCMRSPDKANYRFDVCYQDADCMYRNKDNDDKSACAVYKQACADAYKENTMVNRLEYCRDNKFEGMTANECRLYLNQK